MAGLQAYLVLTGSTRIEELCDYVYQPTRVLESDADLVEELKTGVDCEGSWKHIQDNVSRAAAFRLVVERPSGKLVSPKWEHKQTDGA